MRISLLLVLVLLPVLMAESKRSTSWSLQPHGIPGFYPNREALSALAQGLKRHLPEQYENLTDSRDSALDTKEKPNKHLRKQLAKLQEDMAKMKTKLPRDFIELDDGWILAFRGTHGIGVPVYDTWINKGHHDDDPLNRATLPCGCTTVNGSLPCDRHYRSRLIDVWPSASIDKVKLALYENGVEKQHVTFTGTGSDYKSWLTQSRVIESSWVDLKNAKNLQDFKWEGGWSRRLYLIHSHNGCNDDVGWLTMKDVVTDDCNWGKVHLSPAFLYSPAPHRQRWNKATMREADVLAVLIKLRPRVQLYKECH